MKIRFEAESRRGSGRNRNEDRILVEESCHAFAVADGLGGLPGGDLASETAVNTIRAIVDEDGCAAFDDISSAMHEADAAVATVGEARLGRRIGTTLTLAHLQGNFVRVAHAGDSAAFLFRREHFIPLTPVSSGTRRENLFTFAPYSDSYRTELTSVLGSSGPLEVDLSISAVEPGDRLVLATDGITRVLTVALIASIVVDSHSPGDCCRRLLDAAAAAGATDDHSAVVVFIDEIGD